MKRILFSGDGSSGDLLPMVLMAREFQGAGYEVCVCGSSELSQIAADFGVPFEGYPHNYSKLYLDGQRTGYIHNMRENIKHQEMLYQGEYDLLSKIAPQYDVLINFLAEIFVPSIAEAFRMPNIKLYTFPVVRCDRYAPPTGLPFVTENGVLNQLQWSAAVVAATLEWNTVTASKRFSSISARPCASGPGDEYPIRTWSSSRRHLNPSHTGRPVARQASASHLRWVMPPVDSISSRSTPASASRSACWCRLARAWAAVIWVRGRAWRCSASRGSP